ncbi:MAG: RdgB/HAM1 family non-canonical purine NTP pyrophosphatase [Endomicrobium sp.]|jgi:XTP/dITP diphosphohydrolase|nr:RdgB/HAM1 family non-canonical purine NTP pyrophosphatase [Endomicrobium sp.]
MGKEIIIVTANRDKEEEIKAILKDLDIKFIPMFFFSDYPVTIEDGQTLEENASKKARESAMYFKSWTIADDSGLEVDYLKGKPGVYSSRYAGEKCSYKDNNNKLLEVLKDVPKEKRTAKFKTVIALSSPDGKVSLLDGEIFGTIGTRMVGNNGFGYDPVFYVSEYGKTLAELDSELKNLISHRAKALLKAKEFIKKLLNSIGK